MTTYLTAKEIFELKRLCANPFLELGMTLRPEHLKCFEPHIVTTSVALVIRFPTNDSSEHWNNIHEKRILRSGHMATAALTVLVSLLGAGTMTTTAIGTSAAIAKDEIQAKIWYPKAHRGWSLTRTYHFNYQQLPRKNFTMHWSDIIRDENGHEHEKRSHDVFRLEVGGPAGIPEELVKKIMTRFPQYKSIDFKRPQ